VRSFSYVISQTSVICSTEFISIRWHKSSKVPNVWHWVGAGTLIKKEDALC
jgi:hypothetical protein